MAVGHALRLPLEGMVDSLKTYSAGPNRFELVAEVNGVQFINDSKATSLDALTRQFAGRARDWAVSPIFGSLPAARIRVLNFMMSVHLLSKRVKGAFLMGEASERMHDAWSVFTPCTVADSLLEAVAEAAKNATSGDVVLLSPACSSWDQFRNHQHRGEVFCQAVKSIGRVCKATPPIETIKH